MYKLKLLRNNALLLSEPDMTSSTTQQEYLGIEATAAHPDDPSKRHICIHHHPKDMVGLEIEATAAHPDDRSQQLPYILISLAICTRESIIYFSAKQ